MLLKCRQTVHSMKSHKESPRKKKNKKKENDNTNKRITFPFSFNIYLYVFSTKDKMLRGKRPFKHT